MSSIFIFLMITALISGYTYYREKKKEEEAEEILVDPADRFVHETRDLVLETLSEMGCEYEEDEDNKIFFTYQGERFMIEASNNYLFINVYDIWWHRMSTYCDVEEFAYMQKAINNINAFVNCTVLYTINKEEEEIGIHSKKNMLFVRQIPDLKAYLKSTLEDFFMVQRMIMTEMEKMKVTEEQQ